jgi:hypothetical protein
MKREDATAAGLAIGRARRRPNASEMAKWCRNDNGIREAFFRGLIRGRRLAAKLQQLELSGVA